VNAPVVSLCATLLAGGSVVIAPRFSLSRFWEWCERYEATWASIVPTILALLLTTEKPAFLPGKLRFIRTASAHLPPAHLEAFERRFDIPVTEAASQVCANPLPPELHLPGSVGRPTGVQLRICVPHEQELRDVMTGEVGEVCIAGPSVISAYWGNVSAETFHGGWFRTGDLGYCDAGGYVYLTGRLRDTIIRGGENIAPAEIEDVLLAHPAIREVAVVGAPDELYGEQVVAYIVLHEAGVPLAERTLHDFCQERLSKAKVPARFMILEALPRTHAGKLDRQRLRFMALSIIRSV
jgi:acyl-CoA synthetase (AMP-forming)/AMP-acid ligase II